MSHAFPKSRHVRQRREFDRIYRQGRVLQDDFFRIHYCSLKNSDEPGRLGLTVGKSLGKAVQRNRIKRILREIFRQHPEFSVGLELIVQPKPALAPLENAKIGEFFLQVLQNLHGHIHR